MDRCSALDIRQPQVAVEASDIQRQLQTLKFTKLGDACVMQIKQRKNGVDSGKEMGLSRSPFFSEGNSHFG